MNHDLDNLKEKLNSTILRDVDFSEKSKENVRRAIREYQGYTKPALKQKLNYIFSITASCLLIFGIGYFTIKNIDNHSDNKMYEVSEGPPSTQSTKNKTAPNENENIYIPSEKEEFYGEMAKEEIVDKMLNTPLYFQTAEGKFENSSVNFGSQFIEFKISNGDEVGGYVSVVDQNQERINVYNDTQIWEIDLIENSFVETGYEPKEFQPVTVEKILSEVTSIEAYGPLRNDLYFIYDRQIPPVWLADISLFPFAKTIQYLSDYELWEIEKQNERVLDHNTIVLYGKVSDEILQNINAKTFRFWVDKDTGILVKYEEYDSNGNVVRYLHPEQLKVNVPINLDDFKPNLDGLHKKGSPFDDEGIEYIAHADYYKDKVNEVLNMLRQDIDFLYEFMGDDFDLYSASYERYNDYNHAYLTYSYKKDKNEDGSGTKLLYVRAYHKDSTVRSWGEFDTIKGELLESFTTNGINWTMYELDSPYGNAHLIGTKNDYVYEIVSQDISPNETKSTLESFNPSTIK